MDLGLGQINSRNLPALNLTIDQVMEPCTNIAAATVLGWGYSKAQATYGPGQRAHLSAISAYNTGNGVSGFHNGYVQKVVAAPGAPIAPVSLESVQRDAAMRLASKRASARSLKLAAMESPVMVAGF